MASGCTPTATALFEHRSHQFWMGRPLNPSFPGFPNFDIKSFNEVRPGIIGWVMLNIGFACAQYERLGRVTNSMWLVLAFEGWYSLDCLLMESSIMTQMDITTDGFGFMLSFGDLTWVPFTFTTQARYLVFAPQDLSYGWVAFIVALEVLGQYIFRSANNEKNDFRNGKNPKSASPLSQAPDLTDIRPHVHADHSWYQAPHLRMVGPLAPPGESSLLQRVQG